MAGYIEKFDGKMDKKSVGASIYSYWQYYFYSSLLRQFTDLSDSGKDVTEENWDDETKLDKFWTVQNKIRLLDNFSFGEFYKRLITNTSKEV